MNIRDALKPKEPRVHRWSDLAAEYYEREVLIDPLTQRRVPPVPREGNTSQQALERGHWNVDTEARPQPDRRQDTPANAER